MHIKQLNKLLLFKLTKKIRTTTHSKTKKDKNYCLLKTVKPQ